MRRHKLPCTAAGALGLLLFASPDYAQRLPAPATTSTDTTASVSSSGATKSRPSTGNAAIRTLQVSVPEDALADLRRRINATRWPDKETVADGSQGAHGWPGSVIEQLKIIGPLTDPTAHGGPAEDAFDVVIPSIPGYGFSSRPTETGWGGERIGRAWDVLMKRLGYTRYVSQGGDFGAVVNEAMGRQAPSGLLGIHVNLPAAVPAEVSAALASGGPPPAGLSDREREVFDALRTYAMQGNTAYVAMLGARPQAVGYGLTDSPVGLAGFMLQHPGFAKWTYGDDPQQSPTRDDVLDDFTLYWLTNTAASAARLYWENGGRNVTSAAAQRTSETSVPVAVTVFPDEVYRPPETWVRRAYPKLIYFHEAERGGHFAAWEYPEVFAAELRAAFKPLR